MLSTWDFQPVFFLRQWKEGICQIKNARAPCSCASFPGSSPSGSHPTTQLTCLYQVSHPLLWREINLENTQQLLRTHNYGEHLSNTSMDARGIQTGKEICIDLNRYFNVFCQVLFSTLYKKRNQKRSY